MDGHRTDTVISFERAAIASGQTSADKNASGDGHETRITAHIVKALDAPARGNKVVWDSDLTGFGVRITAAGSVSFVLRYVLDGRERRYTIGKHPDLTASAARDRATVLRGRITMGEDPLEARREARKAATVAELCDDYLERHARPKKRKSSVEGDEHLIEAYIKPELGARKTGSITRRDLDEIHQALSHHPYQANRLLALLSKMFSLAVAWGWRADNPAKGIERFAEDRRERWLSADELGTLSRALAAHKDRRVANAIRLLVLTGARRGEVLNATWDQFDLTRGVWVKPSHHTKQKKTEHVPLSGAARLLVSEMRTAAVKALGGEEKLISAPYLFPGDVEGKPLQVLKRAWKTICERAGLGGVRIHDLRHTYASHLVSGGHSLPLVGRLLGHTQAATTQRYAHLADDPLRKASDEFGKIFQKAGKRKAKRHKSKSAKTGGNVVPFKKVAS
jgi:integrase